MADFFKSSAQDIGKLLVRIALGGILIFHGISKLTHGIEWLKGLLAQFGLPGFLAYGPYLGEVVAPLLIILGLLTRPAAFVIAVDMIMAFVLVVGGRIFSINPQGGGWAVELEAIILLAALSLFFMGPGKYSISKGRSTWG